MKRLGQLRYGRIHKFYVEDNRGKTYRCDDTEQKKCFRIEIRTPVLFIVNGDGEASEIELLQPPDPRDLYVHEGGVK